MVNSLRLILASCLTLLTLVSPVQSQQACITLEQELVANKDIISQLGVYGEKDSLTIWEAVGKKAGLPEFHQYAIVKLLLAEKVYGLAAFDKDGCLIPQTFVTMDKEVLEDILKNLNISFPEMIYYGTI